MIRLFTKVKEFMVILFICTPILCNCQTTNPSISTNLPQVFPPSPTVSALMKFEDVPVSNYTGIPDISIPIYSIPSKSKDIVLDLSLKYHPSSAAITEESAYTGLGWSLIGGGTISRTVRGFPDELNEFSRKGIHIHEGENGNKYHEVIALQGMGSISNEDLILSNKYHWEVSEKGMYDTEHDLYQFSFMGYSGRFYITKIDNVYKIERLFNDNSINIEYNNTLKKFTLYDDKGYKYEFDIHEISTSATMQEFLYFDGTRNTTDPTGYEYISAFHLSKIKDSNNNVLIEYIYNSNSLSDTMHEGQTIVTTVLVDSEYVQDRVEGMLTRGASGNEVRKFEPKELKIASTIGTRTKKMKTILVPGKSRIYLNLINDRQDTGNENNYRLKEIKIEDWDYNQVKRVEFTYNYSSLHLYSFMNETKRLMLSKVTEYGANNNNPYFHELFYARPESETEAFGTDYWGFLNNKPSWLPPGTHREPTKECIVNVLQKMTLPTGGCVIFNFEPNTYSYIGNQPVVDFYQNYDNWFYDSDDLYFSSSNDTIQKLKYTFNERYVTFQSWSSLADGQPGTFFIRNNDDPNNPLNINCGINRPQGCILGEYKLQRGLEYRASFEWFNSVIDGDGTLKVNMRIKVQTPVQHLNGGGVRIKNIGYFAEQVYNTYYQYPGSQTDILPVKRKDYDYSFFDNPKRSSGALVYPKAIFEYSGQKTHHIEYFSGYIKINEELIPVSYKYSTNFSKLTPVRTHGADVGYRNVTVSESGNGKTQYTYTSPITDPEDESAITLYLSSKNIDYKRGLLKNEKYFTEKGTIIKENIFNHNIEETTKTTGYRSNPANYCTYSYKYATFAGYYGRFLACNNLSNTDQTCSYLCGPPVQYITLAPVVEAFGWVTLKSKITKDYYYDRNNKESIVETKEQYTFNPVNKKLSDYVKYTHKVGPTKDTHREIYTYRINIPLNKLSDIETVTAFANGEQVSKQKINYNSNHYPQSISAVKGTSTFETLEDKVLFNRYDSYGNPLEVQRADGIKITYIRDANTTDPLAVIENASYDQIIALLGNPPSGFTQTNIATLNGLRASLPNARVTTYTYKPLVGISSVTDPRGISTKYEYDGFGRLKAVRDNKDKLLSENEYKYRTQN